MKAQALRNAVASAAALMVLATGTVRAADAPAADPRAALTAAGMSFEEAQLLRGAPRLEALREVEHTLAAGQSTWKDNESRAAAAFLAGCVHLELGDTERARKELERASGPLRDTPFGDDAEFARITALAAAGRDADAAREWTKWETRFAKSPLLPEARLAQAWTAMRLGKVPEADKQLTALVAAHPWMAQDSRVVLARAFAAYRSGRAAEALATLSGASGDRAVYLRGLCLASQGDLIRAAAAFQEVAERHRDSPLHDPALFEKANMFLRARAYRGAADEFTRVRERMQNEALRAESELRAAAAVFLAGGADSAATLLAAVVTRHPQEDVAARAQFLLGEVAYARGAHENAITEYNRVLTSHFEHAVAASAQYRVARCLDALGRRADATGAYRAVVAGYAAAPEAPAAAYLAGVGLLELGKPAQAAAFFQIVVDRYAAGSGAASGGPLVFASPAHQELVEAALCLLELSYHRVGDLGRLSGAPHLLLKRMPPSTSIWRGYALLIDADAQAALGRHAEAEATLQGLMRDYPNQEIALAANQLLAWTFAKSGRDSLAVATEERMLARYAARDARRLASSFLHVAHVRFNQKRYREAARAYEDFMQRFPDHAQRQVAAYQAGLAYLRLDRAGDAVDRWESIVRDSATTPIAERAWARAADTYFQAERYADAKRCYQGLLQHFAGSSAAAVASLRLAQCEYNAGNDAAAVDAFAGVESRFPGSPYAREAARGIELALYRLGQKPNGDATLARLVEQYPASSFAAGAQFEIARRLHARKDWEAAAGAFRRVVVQFPGSPNADRAQLALAECLTKAGRADEARAAQEQFLTLFPTSTLRSSVLFQLASDRFEAKDYAQAAVHFERVTQDSVAADVRSAALFNLAQCQRQLGATAEVRTTLERYAREFPGDERAAQVAYELGDLAEAAGDHAAALTHYQAALDARPAAALATELRYRSGRCHELAGDPPAAIAAYEKAGAASDKDDPYRLSALARCASLYESGGDTTRARAAYRDIARNAKDPELAAAAAGKARDLGAEHDKR